LRNSDGAVDAGASLATTQSLQPTTSNAPVRGCDMSHLCHTCTMRLLHYSRRTKHRGIICTTCHA
jgi:hypothetical protein